MTDHITEWLSAYHDGELHGARLHRVEAHLSECAGCRAELDQLRALSALLQEAPSEASFLPAERFAANLALQLPRRPEPPAARARLEIGWWMVPVGLLAIWVFIGITYSLGSAVGLVANSGLFDGNLAWLQGDPTQMGWFTTATSLFGAQLGVPGREALGALNNFQAFFSQLLQPLLLQALVAAAYLGWLFAWWLRQQDEAAQKVEASL
jgi:Putative zinc-finger